MALQPTLPLCILLFPYDLPYHDSPFNYRHGINANQAFETLCLDIVEFQDQGRVIVMGDLNARVGQMQFQPIMADELDKEFEFEVHTG